MSTAVQIPNISQLLDKVLLEKREAEGERPVAGNATWRASKLGSCLRAQYLSAVEHRSARRKLTAKDLKRFAVGDAWGLQFRQWFEQMGILIHEEYELTDPNLDVGAHVDFIIGNDQWRAGIELKSMNSKYFWWQAKTQGPVASLSHLLQAATYSLLYQRQTGEVMPWLVVCASKDDLTLNQDLVTDAHVQDALRRLQLLNQAKASGVAPKCECLSAEGVWGGREWKWCEFAPENDGKNPPKECCT